MYLKGTHQRTFSVRRKVTPKWVFKFVGIQLIILLFIFAYCQSSYIEEDLLFTLPVVYSVTKPFNENRIVIVGSLRQKVWKSIYYKLNYRCVFNDQIISYA